MEQFINPSAWLILFEFDVLQTRDVLIGHGAMPMFWCFNIGFGCEVSCSKQ